MGRIAGELQHFFLQGTGNKYNAERTLAIFYGKYASHFPNHSQTFHEITSRLPFQISVTLLRIARNAWISKEHAHKLIEAAKETLENLTHMSIEAILFDVNGSLVDILTDEGSIDVFRKMRNLLLYQGILSINHNCAIAISRS